METPWGHSQTVEELADGITWVTTASHGGVILSAERQAQIPECLQGLNTYGGGMNYEEDCEWCIPALVWPEVFAQGWPDVLQHAELTLRSVYPEAAKKWFK